MVKKERALFDMLNMLNFDVTKNVLLGRDDAQYLPNLRVAVNCDINFQSICEFPAQIQDALRRAAFDSNSQVGIIFHEMDALESPPTYFRTDKFMNAFQEIVDAYGVARYQESNPAVYSVITFHFLFAVMFGDWGHGICLLLGSLILIPCGKKLGSRKLDSFMEIAFGGRYVILLMALFSIYCGLIYIEFFSVPFHIFGASAFKCQDSTCRINEI